MADAVAPVAPAPVSKSTPAPTGGVKPTPVVTTKPVPGAAPVQEAPKAPPSKVKWKEKVNGQEVELEATEEDLRAAYRQRKSVHDTARQAAEERKQAAAERAAAARERQELEQDELVRIRRQKQKDPNFDELGALTKYVQQRLEQESEDPVQRALKDKDAFIEKMQNERKEEQRKRQEESVRAAERQQLHRVGGQLHDALKALNLPPSDFWLERTAMTHFAAAEEKGLDLTPAELAAETRRETAQVMDQLAEGMDDDALLETFPTFARRLLAAAKAKYARKLQGGTNPTSLPPPRRNVVTPVSQETRMTEAQAFAADKAAGVRKLRSGI